MSALQTSGGQSIYSAYSMTAPVSYNGYQTNNQYANFPPKMNDGRSVVASWQPGAVVNENLMNDTGVTSNWQYRKYLIENGNEIRRQNFMYACNDTGYFIRNESTGIEVPKGYSGPAIYSSVDEPVKHMETSVSDLKQSYLSREQLDARRVIPTMTQDELIKKWGNVVVTQDTSQKPTK